MRRFLLSLLVVIALCGGMGCFGGWLHGSWEIVAEPPRQFAWEKETTTVGGVQTAAGVVGRNGAGAVTITRERGR